MNPEITKAMPDKQIVQTYITTIDLRDSLSKASVVISIFKKNDWWKSGWYFEGMVLEPVKIGDPDEI